MQPRLQKAHDETQAAKAEAVRHMRLKSGFLFLSVLAKRSVTTGFQPPWNASVHDCRRSRNKS